MKRSTLLALIAAAIIVAGALAFVMTRGSSESATPLSDAAENADSTPDNSAASDAAVADEEETTTADVKDLMAPGPLPEQVMGKADAPVTIVEYASLTCPHCAHFHKETFPALKKNYVDTGKVRFIFREFPLDNYATAGFMMARCSEGKFFPILDAFFAQQQGLMTAEKPFDWIQSFGKQVGFSQESLDSCLSNQSLLDSVMAVRQRASEKFGVNSTPTFFINGKIHRGAMTIEELDKELAPLING